MIQCYGITKKKKQRCRELGPNNGYCRQHIKQDLTGRPTCVSLNSRGVRCMLPEDSDNKCRLHSWDSSWLARYWSIINDKG